MNPSTKSPSILRSVVPGMFWGLLCLGVAPLAALEFEAHELILDRTAHQTVFTADLLGDDGAEVVVVNAPGGAQIYAWSGNAWEVTKELVLPAGVQFVDVARTAGRDRLIAYAPGRILGFDPLSGRPTVLTELTVPYRPGARALETAERTRTAGVPRVDVTRDLNDDGFDDVIVPDREGFWVSIQEPGGTFGEAVRLGPPEPFLNRVAVVDSRPYGDTGITAQTVPWYLSRVHRVDFDRDGRRDLVFWNSDHFEVYLQDGGGNFLPVPETFTTHAPFDADGTYSLIFAFEGESMFRLLFGLRSRSEHTVLHSFRDLTGDGVEDMLTQTISGRSAMRQRNRFHVHRGFSTPEGWRFDPEPATTIRPRRDNGQPIGYADIEFQDLDGDEVDDVTLGRVRTGIPGMMRALLASSVAVDLDFYVRRGGAVPAVATRSRRIRPRLAPFKKGVFFPVVVAGDVDGDGHPDLLFGETFDRLHVHRGLPSPALFEEEPIKVTVRLPSDERNLHLEDLDGDGRQDIVIHHPAGTDRGTVVLLLSR